MTLQQIPKPIEQSHSKGSTRSTLDASFRWHDNKNYLILLTCLLIGGLIALQLGKDVDFDIANYHYYNAYALIHGLATKNYWPPSYLHMYLNPVADLLNFAVINTFSAKLAVFLSGALHGFNLFLLFLIASRFVDNNYYPKIFAFLIALIGIFGPLALPSIGNFKNDQLIAILILGFVYLMISFWQPLQNTKIFNLKRLAAAGFLLGFGVGLKLTGFVYIIGACLSILLLPVTWRTKLKVLVFSMAIVSVGFLFASGYWMWQLWQQYHNPVFPFYNGIFHSPEFGFYNINFPEHLPGGFLKTLFFPFYFSFSGTYTDGRFRDFRFLIAFILAFILLAKYLWQKRLNVINTDLLPGVWFLLFVGITYFAEIVLIGGIRYILAIEMLVPLCIYLMLKIIIQKPVHHVITALIFCLLLMTMSSASVGTRIAIQTTSYFDVKFSAPLPDVKNVVVLMPFSVYARSNDPRPQTYLIPFLPKHWRFVGIPFHNGYYAKPTKHVFKNIQKRIDESQHHFALIIASSVSELYEAAAKFGLAANGSCIKIYSERQRVNQQDVLLCPLKKLEMSTVNG